MPWAVAAAAVGAVGANAAAKKSAKAAEKGSTSRVELDPQMQSLLYGTGQQVLKPGISEVMGVGTADDYRRKLNNDHIAKFGIDIPTDQASQDWLTKGISDLTTAGHQVLMNPASDYMDDTGFLGRVTGLLDQQQKGGMTTFGNNIDDYMGDWGANNFMSSQQAAQRLQDSNLSAPTVDAPNQNAINLEPAFQDMIYNPAGSNPYLEGGIQKGINQSNYAFGNYLTDATKATQDMLGNIRGGAIVNGAMGGSRQGIAEGRAIGDLTQNLGRAATQFGQNNTDAAVAARAGAYDTDRNRSLAAMTNLGGQQYGVAQANQQAKLTTNNLNSANQQAGIGLSSGLLDKAYQYGGNNDNYQTARLGQIGGLMAPFTGLGSTQVSTQPVYSNSGASALGGAMLGQQLFKGLNFGGSTPTSGMGSYGGGPANTYYDGYGYMPMGS